MSQRFNENHWWPLTASPLKILDNVYSIGSSTGIAASSHVGEYFEGGSCTNILNKFL